MIRFIDVYKEYDNGTKALRIDDGEFVFLVGPSGSGKSTIIKLITGEIGLTEGKLMVNGYSLNNISPRQVPLMRRTLGIIFQDFRLIFPMCCSWWGWSTRRTGTPASSPAASSSGWPSPGLW